MSLFVLDTDVFTLFRQGHPRVCDAILRRATDDLAVSVITVDESLTGWCTLVRRAKTPDKIAGAYARLADTVVALADFRIVPYTRQAIDRYDSLKRQKLSIGGNDLRIAAIVIEHSATLVTRNLSDFHRIPGLAAVDWST